MTEQPKVVGIAVQPAWKIPREPDTSGEVTEQSIFQLGTNGDDGCAAVAQNPCRRSTTLDHKLLRKTMKKIRIKSIYALATFIKAIKPISIVPKATFMSTVKETVVSRWRNLPLPKDIHQHSNPSNYVRKSR